MVDWLVNAPGGLSYGAGTPRDMSNLATSLPAVGEAFQQARMRAPVIDPATGQPVDPMSENALQTVLREGARRGGLPYLQGVMPYMMWPQIKAIAGQRPAPPAESGAEEPTEAPPGPTSSTAPGAGTAGGTTLASLTKSYIDSGYLAPEVARAGLVAAAKALGRGGSPFPSDQRLTPDQIEAASEAMLTASRPRAALNPAGASVANIMGPGGVPTGYRHMASASPITPPANEGETTPGPTSQVERNFAPVGAQGATGTPGVTGGGQPAETQTPALASAGIQPRALPPGVAQAYAQAGPGQAGRPPVPQRPVAPSPADLSPQQAMRAAGQWETYANTMSRLSAGLAGVPGGLGAGMAAQYKDEADGARQTAKQYREFGLGQQKLEPEEQIAKRAGMTVPEWEAHKASITKDEDAFAKKSQAALETGQTASESRHMIQLGKAIVNSPQFHSGVMQPTTTEFKRWVTALGGDPNAALTPEVFQKLVSNMLTEQIKAMGAAGVGRVLMTEVQNMQKGIASGTLTPASNLLLLELLDRTYQRQSAIAGMVKDIPLKPGQRNVLFQDKIREYNESHPFFSDNELKDMRLIAPPTIRGPADIASWGIKKGTNTPVIWGGQPYREARTGKTINTGDIVRVQ